MKFRISIVSIYLCSYVLTNLSYLERTNQRKMVLKGDL